MVTLTQAAWPFLWKSPQDSKQQPHAKEMQAIPSAGQYRPCSSHRACICVQGKRPAPQSTKSRDVSTVPWYRRGRLLPHYTSPSTHTHNHSQSQEESAATDRLCTPHCNNPAQDRFLHTASKAQEIQGRSRWASTYKGRTRLEAGPWDTTHNCEQAFYFSSPCVYSISHQVGQSKSHTAPSIEMGGCRGEAP